MCVCVEHLNRCKTSIGFACRGTQHFTGAVSNEATSEMGYPAWPAGRTCIVEDSLGSRSGLVVHVRDSVPNRSYDGSFFV